MKYIVLIGLLTNVLTAYSQNKVANYWATTEYVKFEGEKEKYDRYTKCDLKFADGSLIITKNSTDTLFNEYVDIYQTKDLELIGSNDNLKIRVVLKEGKYLIERFGEGVFHFYNR